MRHSYAISNWKGLRNMEGLSRTETLVTFTALMVPFFLSLISSFLFLFPTPFPVSFLLLFWFDCLTFFQQVTTRPSKLRWFRPILLKQLPASFVCLSSLRSVFCNGGKMGRGSSSSSSSSSSSASAERDSYF